MDIADKMNETKTMRNLTLLILMLLLFCGRSGAQTNPVFGPEKRVNITGLTFDAMEPFISGDGNTLFFNSLNSGGNTNLYRASRIDDTTFVYSGIVGGTNDTSSNHLDAVASLDSSLNFFWTSLRGYPLKIENLHTGKYNGGTVTNLHRIYGTVNVYYFAYPFGYLIMDAAVNYQGNQLYYCNAEFDFSNTTCVGVPCESKLGIGQKVNDSTFNRIPLSAQILSNVNDTNNYIIYAPQVTKNGLELYFTRLLKSSVNTEICVAVRSSVTGNFGIPQVIHSNPGFVPEAASPSLDMQKIYYHQKNSTGQFRIYMRYRLNPTGIENVSPKTTFSIYPNPTQGVINLVLPDAGPEFLVRLHNNYGELVFETKHSKTIDLSGYPKGIYLLTIMNGDHLTTKKVILD